MTNSLLTCVLAAATLGACDNDNPMPSSTTSVPPTPTPTPTPTPSPGGATTTVTVGPGGALAFAPATVNINVGDTVHWVWDSTSIPHTVTSGTAPTPDGMFCSAPGTPSVAACSGTGYATTAPSTYDHTFTAAGTFPYFCAVHGVLMTGTVVVSAAGGGGGGTPY